MQISTVTFRSTLFICALPFIGASALADEERLPWGAIKAGNADGSIPAYTGGLPTSTNPPGFKADSGFWADPYADDKPLYTITSSNVDQYAGKLSEATVALLKRFPTYSVPVYQTRRSASYPDWIVENMKLNAAGRCKTIENGEALEGCFGGKPFPVPKNGYEAMWNLLTHYKGYSVWTRGEGWYVDSAGNKVMTAGIVNRYQSNYYDKKSNLDDFKANGGYYLLQNNVYNAPVRNAGEGNLQRKSINPVANADKTWTYSPGQRRVRLAPDTAYDFPIATSGGAALYDEIYMFSGNMDRFDFKLVGTREMIIPYNAYRWASTSPQDLLQKNHPNPDVMRWELHRVTVVEATLKPGQRHVVAKKRFYLDEDIPGAGIYEGWDASGKLSRASWSPPYQAYDKQVPFVTSNWIYEFNTGVYYHSSISTKGNHIDVDQVDAAFYTPEGLARRTQR